jgi:hypothetical protein
MNPEYPETYQLKITDVLAPNLFEAKYNFWVDGDWYQDGHYSYQRVTIYVPCYSKYGIYEVSELVDFLETMLVGNKFDIYVYAKHKGEYVGRIYLDNDELSSFDLENTDKHIDDDLDSLYDGEKDRIDLTKFLIQQNYVIPKTVYREESAVCTRCHSNVYAKTRHREFKECALCECTNGHAGMCCSCESSTDEEYWNCDDCKTGKYIEHDDGIRKITPLWDD